MMTPGDPYRPDPGHRGGGGEGHIGEGQPGKLCQTHAGLEDQFDQGSGAGIIGCGGSQMLVLDLCEDAWWPIFAGWGDQVLRRAVHDDLLLHEHLEEETNRGYGATSCTGSVTRSREGIKIAGEMSALYRGNRGEVARGGEKLHEALYIIAVLNPRARGNPAARLQPLAKLREGIIDTQARAEVKRHAPP